MCTPPNQNYGRPASHLASRRAGGESAICLAFAAARVPRECRGQPFATLPRVTSADRYELLEHLEAWYRWRSEGRADVKFELSPGNRPKSAAWITGDHDGHLTQLIVWSTGEAEGEQAFRYLAAGMADTARDLPPSCARNEASRAVRRSKCSWATGLSSSGERLRVLDPTATCDRAHPAELARWRSGAGRSGRLSFVNGSNRGGHRDRRTTTLGGT